MESIVSDFHIDVRLLLAQVVNFSVVVIVLYFFALKPLVKMMTERSDKITKGLKDAEASRLKLENTSLEAQALLKEARKQGDASIAEAASRAAAASAETIEKTKAQLKAMLNQEKEKIANERERALLELEQESGLIAVALAEKILGQKMDGLSDEKYIKQLIK